MVHVLTATVIVGGAALAWLLCTDYARLPGEVAARICERYEWLFWGSVAAIVATGVGNLGAYGEALPGPETAWGIRLQVKIGAVMLLLAVSAVRTFTITRMETGDAAASRTALRHLYAVTVALGAFVVAMAEALAHG